MDDWAKQLTVAIEPMAKIRPRHLILMLYFPLQVLQQLIDLILLIEYQSHVDCKNSKNDNEKGLAELGDIKIKGVAKKQDGRNVYGKLNPLVPLFLMKGIHLFAFGKRQFLFFEMYGKVRLKSFLCVRIAKIRHISFCVA
jgi:hypothetical protein